MPTAKLSETTAPKPKKPKRAELEQWERLEELRLGLRRDANKHGRDQKKLEEAFEAYVREAGGKGRQITTCGFRVWIETESKAAKMDYRGELIAAIGEAAVEKLEKRAALATTAKDKLRVARA